MAQKVTVFIVIIGIRISVAVFRVTQVERNRFSVILWFGYFGKLAYGCLRVYFLFKSWISPTSVKDRDSRSTRVHSCTAEQLDQVNLELTFLAHSVNPCDSNRASHNSNTEQVSLRNSSSVCDRKVYDNLNSFRFCLFVRLKSNSAFCKSCSVFVSFVSVRLVCSSPV